MIAPVVPVTVFSIKGSGTMRIIPGVKPISTPVVVFQLIDVTVGTLGHPIQFTFFVTGKMPVGLGVASVLVDFSLLMAQNPPFPPGQFSASDAIMDTGALVVLTMVSAVL